MSSTNRGSERIANDYYVTDVDEIKKFLNTWRAFDVDAEGILTNPNSIILDPCAGGNIAPVKLTLKEGKGVEGQPGYKPPYIVDLPITQMSYPTALNPTGLEFPNLITMDIREDSFATHKRDFLNDPCPTDGPPDLIISNPPFVLAMDFIRHSLVMVKDGGYVVFLQRLNFFGSDTRNDFFRSGNMPQDHFTHAKRMSFTPDGKTDSIEYTHLIWRKTGDKCFYSRHHVLEY